MPVHGFDIGAIKQQLTSPDLATVGAALERCNAETQGIGGERTFLAVRDELLVAARFASDQEDSSPQLDRPLAAIFLRHAVVGCASLLALARDTDSDQSVAGTRLLAAVVTHEDFPKSLIGTVRTVLSEVAGRDDLSGTIARGVIAHIPPIVVRPADDPDLEAIVAGRLPSIVFEPDEGSRRPVGATVGPQADVIPFTEWEAKKIMLRALMRTTCGNKTRDYVLLETILYPLQGIFDGAVGLRSGGIRTISKPEGAADLDVLAMSKKAPEAQLLRVTEACAYLRGSAMKQEILVSLLGEIPPVQRNYGWLLLPLSVTGALISRFGVLALSETGSQMRVLFRLGEHYLRNDRAVIAAVRHLMEQESSNVA